VCVCVQKNDFEVSKNLARYR